MFFEHSHDNAMENSIPDFAWQAQTQTQYVCIENIKVPFDCVHEASILRLDFGPIPSIIYYVMPIDQN